MATKTNNGTTSGHPSRVRRPYVTSEVVNFASFSHAASDVIQALNVPANTIVLDAGIEVLTADTAGNSGTINLNDGTTTWVAAAAPTATGQMVNASVANIVKGSADTLDITVATGAVNAKVRVWAILCDLGSDKTAQVLTYS